MTEVLEEDTAPPQATRHRPPRREKRQPRVLPDDPDQLLTIEQVAKRFQVTSKTVRKLVTSGELRVTKVGPTSLRFKPQWVDDYLERQR